MANNKRSSGGSSRGSYDRDWERSRGEGYRSEGLGRESFGSEFEGGYGRGESDRGSYGQSREDYQKGNEPRVDYGGSYGSQQSGGGYESHGRDFGGDRGRDFGGGRGTEFGGGRGEFGTGRSAGSYGSQPELSGGFGAGTWGSSGSTPGYGGGFGRGDVGQRGFGETWGRPGRGMRGRGPKGFQRTDESIRERVSEILEQDDDLDASEIEVQVNVGEVTLIGTVEDRADKRRAEELIENQPGVREVHNQLRISRGVREKNEAARGTRPPTKRGERETRTGSRR